MTATLLLCIKASSQSSHLSTTGGGDEMSGGNRLWQWVATLYLPHAPHCHHHCHHHPYLPPYLLLSSSSLLAPMLLYCHRHHLNLLCCSLSSSYLLTRCPLPPSWNERGNPKRWSHFVIDRFCSFQSKISFWKENTPYDFIITCWACASLSYNFLQHSILWFVGIMAHKLR